FGELGRALGEHFSRPDAATWQGRPDAAGDAEPPDQRQAVLDAVRRVREAAQQFGDQASEAVRDQELRESAQRAARGLADALETTFGQLAGQLRARAGGPGEPAGDTWSSATGSGPGPSAGPPPVSPIESAPGSAAGPAAGRDAGGADPDRAPGDDADTGQPPARPPSDS
ncbi:MAG TPA: hypothetical protein VF109_10670, partial [Mycobacteriales bacterium]